MVSAHRRPDNLRKCRNLCPAIHHHGRHDGRERIHGRRQFVESVADTCGEYFARRGSDANRTVTVTPAADSFGSAIITLTANDGTRSASESFVVAVNSSDAVTLPTITNIADLSLDENATTTTPIEFTISESDTDASTLNVSANSSNSLLLPNSGIQIQENGELTITPAANQSGSTTITLIVTDADSQTALTSFPSDRESNHHPPHDYRHPQSNG